MTQMKMSRPISKPVQVSSHSLEKDYHALFRSQRFKSHILPSPARQKQLTNALFIGAAADVHGRRATSDRPGDIFPNLVSGSKEEAAIKRDAFEQLTDACPESETDDAGLSNWRATPSDWSKLLTVMPSAPMLEATIPPVSTQLLRESYKLKEVIQERHRKIAIEVFLEMTRDRAHHGLVLSRKSSSSGPYYAKSASLKKKQAMHGLVYKHQMAELIARGQYSTLWKEYGVPVYHHLVERHQPDGYSRDPEGNLVPKERLVTDLEYALTGGEAGSRFAADKSHPNGLARARKRTAFATAGCLNNLLSALFQPWAKYAYSEFEFTWKTTSADHLLSKMKQFNFFVASDTTAHDQIYSKSIFELFFEACSTRLKDGAISVLRSIVFAPYHMTSPYLGEKFDMWVGDPMKPEAFDMHLGLPSGLGPNSFIGRWWMTSFALMIIDSIKKDVLGNVRPYLKGQRDIAVCNSADDMLFCCIHHQHYVQILDALKAENGSPAKERIIPPYMTMNHESPIAFLGYVPYKDKNGNLQVTSNVTSFIVNRLCPERPITSPARKFWALGLDAVRIQFGTAPMFDTAFQIFDEALYKHIGTRYNRMIEQFGAVDLIKSRMAALTTVDLELLDNPDKIHYKFDQSDVDPIVYDEITLTLPFETVEPLRVDWYK